MTTEQRKKEKDFLYEQYSKVESHLEFNFHIDINTRVKILDEFFSEDYLPLWYFYSNTPETISYHIYTLTHYLNANSDMLALSNRERFSRTYFVNIGRDHTTTLREIVARNMTLQVQSMDASATASGLLIAEIDFYNSRDNVREQKDAAIISKMYDLIKNYKQEKYRTEDSQCIKEFISTLSPKYMREELLISDLAGRINRHLYYYHILETQNLMTEYVVTIDNEHRISIAGRNVKPQFLQEAISIFLQKKLNIYRLYYDTFEYEEKKAEVISFYLLESDTDTATDMNEICNILEHSLSPLCSSHKVNEINYLEKKIERLIVGLSLTEDQAKTEPLIEELRILSQKNLERGTEIGNYFLNCVSDFFEAAKVIGIDTSPKILKMLLGFERFDSFFVDGRRGATMTSYPAYRTKHSTVRGQAKGGLRIDPIVNFSEVAALAFMMTWKCARSRILYGGCKGGLMLKPSDFDEQSVDMRETLSSFGRSLFLVTGPYKDVPGGDLGCGPAEIGKMFEGFKAALRDLALMVNGVRSNPSLIGDQIVSLEMARRILKEAFDINFNDKKILSALCINHHYLELVASAQITGKAKMGVAVRTGATGRGVMYATLAMVGNLYLEGAWHASEDLTSHEEELLKEMSLLNASNAPVGGNTDRISADKWEILVAVVSPKLLRGKKAVVQGIGKVGSSIILEMQRYGVEFIAISDAGGAIIGECLDMAEVFESLKKHRTIIYAQKSVDTHIEGVVEAGQILELECDFLFPAAMENAVTEANAYNIKAKVVVCGGNGTNSAKAEQILQERGIPVVYDFLANGGGVVASYFEWLRNISERYKYEAENILGFKYDVQVMTKYIMPEYQGRILRILDSQESDEITHAWNTVMRDIIFSAVNEDFHYAQEKNISMKTAGYINAQLRVLAAILAKLPDDTAETLLSELPMETRTYIEKDFMTHPEIKLMKCKI